MFGQLAARSYIYDKQDFPSKLFHFNQVSVHINVIEIIEVLGCRYSLFAMNYADSNTIDFH